MFFTRDEIAAFNFNPERYSNRYARRMFRICSGVNPRLFKPSEFTLCGRAGCPTAIT